MEGKALPAFDDPGKPPEAQDEDSGRDDAAKSIAAGRVIEPIDAGQRQALDELAQVQAQLSPSIALEQASAAVVAPDGEVVVGLPPPEGFGEPPPPPEDPVTRLADAIAKANAALAQTDPWTQEQKIYARRGYWISIGAVLVGAAASLTPAAYEWIHSAVRKTPDAWSGDLTDAQVAALQALVQAWSAWPDDQLWEHCASFSDAHKPQVATQILICQDIVTFSPAVPWTWSAQDKDSAVQNLTDAYTSSGHKGSAVYKAVEAYRYNGQPLPRGIGANCCLLAFSSQLAG